MRRKIELYIAGNRVDLGEDAIILFNYTQDDLTNPAVVKNSYSSTVTLQGTAKNNAIFGDVFRLDRLTVPSSEGRAGRNFDPLRRTPFAIYSEAGEILESGYVKLDSITRRGGLVEYNVTLYGGLGSFFYALSYNEQGEKLTLADLDFLQTDSPATELDFDITAAAVQAAWDALDSGAPAGKWSVINFAPCYNGIPDGEFSADKALLVPSTAGAADTVTEDGKVYGAAGQAALFSLPNAVDEWAAKDLRSYLQRPVVSVKAVLDAICNPANNGGYEVDMSDLGYLADDLWLTLPLLPNLGSYRQITGELEVTYSGNAGTGTVLARYSVNGAAGLPFGTAIKANITTGVGFSFPSTVPANLNLQQRVKSDGPGYEHGCSGIFIQAVALDGNSNEIAASPLYFVYSGIGGFASVQDAAQALGFNRYTAGDEVWNGALVEGSLANSAGLHRLSSNLNIEMTIGQANALDRVEIRGWGYSYTYKTRVLYPAGGNSTAIEGFTTDAVFVANYGTGIRVADTFAYTTSSKVRSGAHITKAMLLSGAGSPADVLLSFAKTYGLNFLYDQAAKKVTVLRRNSLYRDRTLDLSGRIDRSRDIKIVPFVFDKKWYEFQHEQVGGKFADEYKKIQGKEYGLQRVNTGFDFNTETVKVLDGSVFKSAVTVLESGRYFNILKAGNLFYPSPLLDAGAQYTLRAADGSTKDVTYGGIPATVVPEYYNDFPGHEGYDIEGARKVQFHSADGKPVDGAGVLVFLEGWNSYSYFKLSDDVAAMDTLNGKPCWLLAAGTAAGQRLPVFQRYTWAGGYPGWTVQKSLDFGVPAELDIPGITYPEDRTIYAKAWQAFMRDRYDRDAKVLTAYVNLSGLQVGPELLRNFYWFEGALWVINAIRNYSITTYDLAECEFIKVKDKANYLTGQTL